MIGRMKMSMLVLIAGLLALALVLSACAIHEEPDTVKVQLKWKHHPQFVGLYVARDAGFYSESNLEVTLLALEEGTTREAVRDLSEGKTDFAVIGAAEFLLARDQGEPVVAVAVIFQRNPVVYGSLEDSGIKHPQDLAGKTVMATGQGRIQHEALMKKLDMDPARVEVIPYEPGLDHLVDGTVDAQMMYRVGTGLELEEAGYEMSYMRLDDYGIQPYGDVIATTEELIRDNPSLVERFVQASIAGWRNSIQHREEARDIVLGYASDIGPDLAATMIEEQIPLLHDSSVPLGFMEDRIWDEIFNLLHDAGILEEGENVRDAYTNDFVGRL